MTTLKVASRCAAPNQTPATGTTPTTEDQAFALLDATNCASLAAWYIKRDNITQARRKLRQALEALSVLEVAHV